MIPHGTIGGYTNHGCRCRLCKDANRDHRRRYVKNPQVATYTKAVRAKWEVEHRAQIAQQKAATYQVTREAKLAKEKAAKRNDKPERKEYQREWRRRNKARTQNYDPLWSMSIQW